MDTYFIYQYTSQLETSHPKFNRKEDLLWYITFCSLVIIVSLARVLSSFPFGAQLEQHLVISARIVKIFHCYNGSWKRGRLPLHFGRSVIRNT